MYKGQSMEVKWVGTKKFIPQQYTSLSNQRALILAFRHVSSSSLVIFYCLIVYCDLTVPSEAMPVQNGYTLFAFCQLSTVLQLFRSGSNNG